MFKRLMILGTLGIIFVLAANYLLVYALNQQVKRERDQQVQNYLSAYAAIVQFGQHPDSASDEKARARLEEASRQGLSKARTKILQSYLGDLERCYQGQRDSCKQATSDMNEAMRDAADHQ